MRPGLAFVLALLAVIPGARAQPEPSSLERARSQLRERAAEALEGCAAGPLIVRVRSELDGDAPDPHGLVTAILGPTLEALGEDGRFDPVHVGSFGEGDEAAQAAARLGYGVLLDLRLRRESGELVVEASSWSTEPPRRHAGATLRFGLDLSLRRHLGFPPALTEETVDARFAFLPGRGYLAVVPRDLDGDGRMEVVTVHREGARVFHLRPGRRRWRLELVGTAQWPDDIPPSLAPRRRILATAVGRGREVVLRHSEHAAPIAIGLENGEVVTRRSDGPCPDERYPVRGGCAELVDGRDFFDDILERGGEPYEAAMHFYVFAADRFETRDGDHAAVEALVNPAGRLALRIRFEPREGDPVPHTAGTLGYGTALAMSDLDHDGSAELLLSHASRAGAGDQISLLRAHPRGAVRVVWRSEVLPGSVWAAGAGDVDDDGVDELVAIEEPQNPNRGRARLWIVQ